MNDSVKIDGITLATIRKACGITQVSLADSVGTNRQAIQDIEAEKKQKAQNKRDGKFTLKEIVEATKKINPQIWTDQNK